MCACVCVAFFGFFLPVDLDDVMLHDCDDSLALSLLFCFATYTASHWFIPSCILQVSSCCCNMITVALRGSHIEILTCSVFVYHNNYGVTQGALHIPTQMD